MKKTISIVLTIVMLLCSVFSTIMLSVGAEKSYVYWKQGDGTTFSHFWNGGFSANADKSVLTFDPSTLTATKGYVCLWGDDAHKLTALKGKTVRLSMDITVTKGASDSPSVGLRVVGTTNRAVSEAYWPSIMLNIGYIPLNTKTKICTTFTVQNIGTAQYIQLACDSGAAFTVENITLAELVENVSATSADALAGTAEVRNTTEYRAAVNGWNNTHYPQNAEAKEYAIGETVTFTAIPNSGYEFDAWKDADGQVVSNNATYITQITTDTNLKAHFKTTTKYLVWKQGDGNTFSHSNNGGFSFNSDKSVLSFDPTTLTATKGYVCLWGDDAHKLTALKGKTVRLSMDITVTKSANDSSSVGLRVVGTTNRAVSEVYWPSIMLNIGYIPLNTKTKICTTFTVQNIGTAQYIQLACDSGATFNIENITLSELVPSVEAKTADASAGIAKVNNTTEYRAAVNGWNNTHYPQSADAQEYATGETATFTAIPNPGYEFVVWKNAENQVASTEASFNTIITDDISLTAYFEKTVSADFYQNFDSKDLIVGTDMSFKQNLEDTDNSSVTLFYDSTLATVPSETSSSKHRINLYNPTQSAKLSNTMVAGKGYFIEFLYKIEDSADQGIEVAFAEGDTNLWTSTWVGGTTLKDTNSEWKTARVEITKKYSTGKSYLHMWLGNGDKTKLGTAKIWVDNVKVYRAGTVTIKKADGITVTPVEDIDYSHAVVGSQFSFKLSGEFERVNFNNTDLTPNGELIYTATIEEGENILKVISPGFLAPVLSTFNTTIVDMDANNASTDNTKWYRPQGGTATIVENGTQRYLDLNGEAYAKLRNLEKNARYTLEFNIKIKDINKTPSSDIIFAIVQGASPSNKISEVTVTADDIATAVSKAASEWASILTTFDIGELGTADSIKIIGSNEYYIDDVEIHLATECKVEISTECINEAEVGGTISITDGKNNGKVLEVSQGTLVTLSAKPFVGFDFVGWFVGDSSVATFTEKDYTFKVFEDEKFVAIFKKSGQQQDGYTNLINDGNFSFISPNSGGKVRWLNAEHSVTYESGREWFIVGGTSNVIVEEGNKYISMLNSGYLMQTVRIENGKEYVLSFKARSDAANGVEARIYGMGAGEHNVNVSVAPIEQASMSNISADGKWHTYNFKFTPTSLTKQEVVIYISRTMGPMDIDDIELVEMTENICAIGTTTFRGGTAEVKGPTLVQKGSDVTFIATPDAGNKFLGWYLVGKSSDGYISTNREFTTAVTDSITLMAVFGGDKYANTTYGIFNGGAENGKTENWIENFLGDGSKISISDKVTHSGNKSIRVDFTGARQGVAPNDAILLRGKCRYTFSGWFYVDESVQQIVEIMPSISTTFPFIQGKTELVNLDIKLRDDMPISLYVSGDQSERTHYYSSFRIDPTNAAYWDAAHKNGGWYEFKMTFDVPVSYDCTVAYFGLRANMLDPNKPALYYLDDIMVTEEELDYSTRRTEETYSDNLYNDLDMSNVTFPNGFEFKNGVLSVSANSGALVIPVETEYLNWYHLGYTVKSISNGSSYIGVAFEEPSGDFKDVDSLGISAFNFKKSNNFVRDGFKFFSENKENKAYIVIYSGSNSFVLKDIFFFNGKYGSATNINNVKYPYYDYEGVGITKDDYDIKWAKFIAEYYKNNPDADGYSPSTGDKLPALTIMLFLLSFTVFGALLINKKEVCR